MNLHCIKDNEVAIGVNESQTSNLHSLGTLPRAPKYGSLILRQSRKTITIIFLA